VKKESYQKNKVMNPSYYFFWERITFLDSSGNFERERESMCIGVREQGAKSREKKSKKKGGGRETCGSPSSFQAEAAKREGSWSKTAAHVW
jgi:hypothetical protein